MDRSNLNRVETTNDADKRRAFKDRLAEKVFSAKPIKDSEDKGPSIPVGSLVWHPDLGAGTVFSVDLSTNNLVLDSIKFGKVDLVLSLVQSKLIPIKGSAPEHVGEQGNLNSKTEFKTTVEEPIVSVVLPPIFKTWKTYDQYTYLTRDRRLSPELANDLLAFFSGGMLFTGATFVVTWDENTLSNHQTL